MRTYKNDMPYKEVEDLMNRLLNSNLHFLDKTEWANGFMEEDASAEEIEALIAR